MPKRTVARISNVVLKWLIPALWGRSIAPGTAAILDLPSCAGYRAKEMPSLCSYFALEHHSPRTDRKCPQVFDSRWSAWVAVINNLGFSIARISSAERFAFRNAING